MIPMIRAMMMENWSTNRLFSDMQVAGQARLKPDEQACLQQDQDNGQRFPVLYTEVENEYGQDHLDKEHDLADRF